MIDLTIQNLTKIIDDYRELRGKIKRITDKFEGRSTEVKYFGVNEPYEEIDTCYEVTCCGEPCDGERTFPVSWLSLTDNELADALYEYRKEQRRLEEEHERKRHEACLKAQEEKERAEYERLKAKFEGEKE